MEGEKTNLSYDFLIKNNLINGITCKNGTIATFNNLDNTINLSNVKIPDYCTMDFKHSFYSKLLSDNSTIKTRTAFNTVFTETNTGTLYKTTESIANSPAKDVYYFAGNATNNWVKFGKYTTNGPIWGHYSETDQAFKEYTTMEECTSATEFNVNCSYAWKSGDDIYWRIVRTNHDGSIRLLYSGTSPDTTSGYIGTSAFNSSNNSPKYVGYMYGTDGSLSESRVNTNNSTIKTYIDNWYSTNLSSYSKYISTEAVYCNDRQLDNGQSWSTSGGFNYITITRLDWSGNGANANPTYNCENKKDAFSGSNSEAKLTYPIGLMTADEINIAGGLAFNNAPAWYYLNSAGGSITGRKHWWSLSPSGWNGSYSGVWVAGGSSYPGFLSGNNVVNEDGVRPAISLKGNLIWKSGDGSSNNPYEVEDLPPTLSEKLLSDNPTIKTRTDFSATFTETNTGTLYKTTESIAGSTPKDVYYFAGDAKNNWVKFANFYWRIIRTNYDGSVRLLYAGTSPDTTEGYIGSSAFNTEFNSPKYVGYMYGEDDSTLEGIRANTKDSTIKTYIDNWYSNNLSAYTKYISTEAVYCNDRQLDNGQTWTYATNQSSQIKFVGYSRIDRDGNGAKAKPTYNCLNSKDAFSGSNIEAKLTYPIALITADELEFAGASTFNALVSPYTWYYNNSKGESIVNDKWWFTMTPLSYVIGEHVQSYVWDVAGKVPVTPGRLGHGYVYGETEEKARPVISLKACTLWTSGNGAPETPYEIVENDGC